jgi:single-strand DNA-binding protein
VDADGRSEKQERVTLAGRVGAKPAFRTTPRGVLVATFPLGVKDEADSEQTTWHTILAFQKRAALVRDTVHKGDALEVIGYRNQRSYTGRDGKDHAVVEVHAAVIKPR